MLTCSLFTSPAFISPLLKDLELVIISSLLALKIHMDGQSWQTISADQQIDEIRYRVHSKVNPFY